MKIAKTVIFLQANDDDDANEMDLIAEGKKHNKTPAGSIQDDSDSYDESPTQSNLVSDTFAS